MSVAPPVFYLLCLYLLNASYALFYRSHRNDGVWKFALPSAFFYIAFSPQVLWAIIRIRDNSWGTRVAELEPEQRRLATVVPFPVQPRSDWPHELYEQGGA